MYLMLKSTKYRFKKIKEDIRNGEHVLVFTGWETNIEKVIILSKDIEA